MKETPKAWKLRKLGEFSKIIMGQSPPGKSYTKEAKGVPLLNGAADFEGKIVRPMQNTTQPTKLSRKGDILLCIRATIGNVTFSDKEYCLGRGVSALRITDKGILPDYISFMLEGKLELLVSRSLGSTIKGIKKEDLENLEFLIPSLPTQERIVATIEKALSIRKKREHSNQITASFPQAVFSKMFGDPSGYPKLWQMTTLESTCSKIVDCPHSTPTYLETGIPLVRTTNIKKGYLDFKETKFISSDEHLARSRRICPSKGDILYAREATFGNAALVSSDREFSVGQRIMLIRPNLGLVKSEFLLWLMNSDYVYSQAAQVARGATNPHVNVADIRKFRIILPPIELQSKFASAVAKFEKFRENTERSSQEINVLCNSLMYRAFNGELHPANAKSARATWDRQH